MHKAFWCQLTVGCNKTKRVPDVEEINRNNQHSFGPPAYAAAAGLKGGSNCVWLIQTYYVDLLRL